jgi:ribose 5-phosphate isomerase B
MNIGLFADHAGYLLKEDIKASFPSLNFIDFGTNSTESVDYPSFGKLAGEQITLKEIDYAILVCGTGIGITIAANRFYAVRGFVAHTLEEVMMARQHNDANAIGFSGRNQKIEDIIPFIEAFLSIPFEGGRHQQRVYQLSEK